MSSAVFRKSVKPLHESGDMHKAQECDVEVAIAGSQTAKDLHALEEVFNQMASLVAVPVQSALLFAFDFGRDDDPYGLRQDSLDNFFRSVGFVCQPEELSPSIQRATRAPVWIRDAARQTAQSAAVCLVHRRRRGFWCYARCA